MLQNVNFNSYSKDNFREFNPKIDMTSNKNYLASVYCQKDTFSTNQSKQKKKPNKTFFLVAGSFALAVLGALGAAVGSKKIDVEVLKKGINNNKTKGVCDAISNLSMNFTNLKDDMWRRFADFLSEKCRIGFIKKGGDKFSDVYRNIIQKGITKRLDASCETMKKLAQNNPEILNELNLKKFDFDSINSQMTDAFREKNISKGLFSLKDGVSGIFKKLTSPIADNAVSDVIKRTSNIIDIEKLKKLNASDALIKEAERYNSIQLKEMFPKLRDINCGSAPTDLITEGVPILGFGAALATIKDEEKRKETFVNVGLPLIPTCLMPFIGLKFPILNGFKGMIAGFAVGSIAKQGVKLISNKQKKNTNKTVN